MNFAISAVARGAAATLACSTMLLTLTIPSAHVARADTPVCAYVGHAIASPAGFDPLNATDDQRPCYGFPPRPTDATSLGVQRTVWGWNLLATPKVSESQQLVAGKSDCLPR